MNLCFALSNLFFRKTFLFGLPSILVFLFASVEIERGVLVNFASVRQRGVATRLLDFRLFAKIPLFSFDPAFEVFQLRPRRLRASPRFRRFLGVSLRFEISGETVFFRRDVQQVLALNRDVAVESLRVEIRFVFVGDNFFNRLSDFRVAADFPVFLLPRDLRVDFRVCATFFLGVVDVRQLRLLGDRCFFGLRLRVDFRFCLFQPIESVFSRAFGVSFDVFELRFGESSLGLGFLVDFSFFELGSPRFEGHLVENLFLAISLFVDFAEPVSVIFNRDRFIRRQLFVDCRDLFRKLGRRAFLGLFGLGVDLRDRLFGRLRAIVVRKLLRVFRLEPRFRDLLLPFRSFDRDRVVFGNLAGVGKKGGVRLFGDFPFQFFHLDGESAVALRQRFEQLDFF